MGEDALVGVLIDQGRRLLDRLPAAGVDVAAAFWATRGDEDQLYLYVVTPDVNGRDARPVYHVINRVLDEQAAAGWEPVDWMVVQAVGTDTPAGRAAAAAAAGVGRPGRWVGRQWLGDSNVVARFLYALPTPAPAPAA